MEAFMKIEPLTALEIYKTKYKFCKIGGSISICLFALGIIIGITEKIYPMAITYGVMLMITIVGFIISSRIFKKIIKQLEDEEINKR